MHCPKCGYQQSGNEVKYCSRCGFYLGMVAELLMMDGTLPGRDIVTPRPILPRRKKRIRQGAKLMFFSLVVLPVAIGLSIAADNPGPLSLPFGLFLAGLFWMLYFSLFSDEGESPVQFPRQMQAPPSRPMLRPEDNYIRGTDPRRANTADMAQPPSVVDHTTQLFDKE